MRFSNILLIGTVLLFIAATPVIANEEAVLMRFPDIHKDQVAFSYNGDIWIAQISGGYARRLTSAPGNEYFPKFSPDGRMIAFTGQYDGYYQAYVIPAEGGTPKQLTHYPIGPMSERSGFNNQVMDWTPDGKYIVFRSLQYHWSTSLGRYYKVSPEGGFPEPLPFSEGATMSFSPDGQKIVYNRNYRDFRTWKRYKGGRAQNIWIYDFKEDKTTQLTDWPATERCPMWHGNAIYFIADKTGTLNLYCYNLDTKQYDQLTDYKDWDILWPGFGPDAVVFERGGKLYRMGFEDRKIEPVPIQIAYDASTPRDKYVNVSDRINEYDLAPGGKRAAFTARGEIFTVPAKNGDTRNITNTSGAREQSITWSPDGKWLAYFCDKTGNMELYLSNPIGENTIALTSNSKVLMDNPVWAPDSKKIALLDLDHHLLIVDIETKMMTVADTASFGIIADYAWAPDSNWLTYSKTDENGFSAIYLYHLPDKKVHRVTSTLTDNTRPAFDPEGKYLYYISTSEYNAELSNLELSFIYHTMDRMYLLTLKKDTPSPFAPESDEVQPVKSDKKTDPKESNQTDKDKKDEIIKPVRVDIDLDGLANRISAIPIEATNFFKYTPIKKGIIYIRTEKGTAGQGMSVSLYGYDLEKKEETKMLSDISDYRISADYKKMLFVQGSVYCLADATIAKLEAGKDKIKTDDMETRVDLRAEWKQMLIEAWRMEKDFFYVSNMHGVDWDQILQKYLPLVDHLTNRSDLTFLIGEMIGELNISHAYTGGGDLPKLENTNTGLLGCSFEPTPEGLFKIRKIFKGENWNPEGRSPLTEPGLKVSEGNYILAINDCPLKTSDSPYRLLQKTAGKTVTLKLNDKPVPEGSWEIKVKPVADEAKLKYLDWVETNRLKVEKATKGRVGYVHIPDMSIDGLNQFVKTWYGQLDKDGIIIDDRFNGGGFVSQMILERVRRFVAAIGHSRGNSPYTYPYSAYSGKLVTLINSYSSSDGDIFPYFFREYQLGPLIGTRTWGGVVGISGRPQLIDGGYVTIPTSGMYSMKGEWIIENEGVSPDIMVDLMPEEEVKGLDPQLDKAIEVIMKKIEEDPLPRPQTPKGPVR